MRVLARAKTPTWLFQRDCRISTPTIAVMTTPLPSVCMRRCLIIIVPTSNYIEPHYHRKRMMVPHTPLSTISLARHRQMASGSQAMASRPQDYVSARGRLTTNSVDRLALVYRDKRVDLGHTHYVCKTNMAICHKVNE